MEKTVDIQKTVSWKGPLAVAICTYLGIMTLLLWSSLARDWNLVLEVVRQPSAYITLAAGFITVIVLVRKTRALRIPRPQHIGIMVVVTGIAAIVLWCLVPKGLLATVKYDLIGFGVGAIGLGVGIYSTGVARDSDKKMNSLANLQFYEKMAVVELYMQLVAESYVPPNDESRSAFASRIFNDIKGAKQLSQYVDPKLKEELDNKIQKLITRTLNLQPYVELVERLRELQEDN
jgi:hypothetical protein